MPKAAPKRAAAAKTHAPAIKAAIPCCCCCCCCCCCWPIAYRRVVSSAVVSAGWTSAGIQNYVTVLGCQRLAMLRLAAASPRVGTAELRGAIGLRNHSFYFTKRHCAQVLLPATGYLSLAAVSTSLKLGYCSKLNWSKRVSADYWLLGTFLYPWP